MNRRNFLASLGLAAAGVAFKPITGHAWLAPRDLISYDGPVTYEWIAAEGLRLLNDSCDLSAMTIEPSLYRLTQHGRQCGIDVQVSELDMHLARPEFSLRYVAPAMAQMGKTIEELKPKRCGILELPAQIDNARSVTNEGNNFNLRFLRAYDIGGAGEYTDDEGETHTYSHAPGFIHRFDMLVAA